MAAPRIPENLEQNRIALAVRRARSGARPLIDLTVTNPTSVGIAYPEDMLQPLASASALTYAPEPFGLASARLAVAGDYARRGTTIDPARIVLTSSTSEAYSFLFKLLCDPCGDAVLVPMPSYPLFDHLTALDGVQAIPYRLDYHGRWTVALDEIDRAWTGRVTAVLAVSPNNPTGSILTDAEREALSSRCANRGAALIMDEVFADYPMESPPSREALRRDRAEALATAGRIPSRLPLTFRLGGLSKSAGLPQVKLGWIAVDGPEASVRSALDRLEIICDAYLSVSTPVQAAAPALIERGAVVRERIAARVRGNYATLQSLAQAHPAVEVLPIEAGWSAVLRVPATRSEEDLVVDLLERDGVLLHPGFFFDFAHEAFVVASLLPEPGAFADGVRKVLERAGG